MDEKITISKSQLRKALLFWEQSARAGLTRSVEEAAKLPVEQVADESTDYLFAALKGE